MLLTKINIKNYRLLVDTWMDVDSSMTLIIGRNNTAKTSCMDIIEKILEGNLGEFSEFNYELDKPENASSNFSQILEEYVQKEETNEILPDE